MKTKWYSMLGLALVVCLGLATQSPAAKGGNPGKPGGEDPPADGLTFELFNLGSISDATSLSVTGINDAGSVIGYLSFDPLGAPPEAFVVESVDGSYSPVQLLPSTSGGTSHATDINASGMITTVEYSPNRAVLWVDGNPIILAEGIGARADGINDAGVVVGSIADVFDDFEQAWILVPLDIDDNGEPDIWFMDENGDEFNDLIMPLTRGYADIWESYAAIDIKNDGRALVSYHVGYDPYEIIPDFADPDGDGNPWFADENGDFFNDLMVIFGNCYVVEANEVGNAVGQVGGYAAMWEAYSTASYINLGVLSRKDSSSGASDINDARWVVGQSHSRKGTKGFLYKDDEMKDFGELCGNATAVPVVINNAGVVAGSIGLDVFVAIPSEAP